MVLRPRVVDDDEHEPLTEQLAQALGRSLDGCCSSLAHLSLSQLGDELAHPAEQLRTVSQEGPIESRGPIYSLGQATR